MLMTCYTCVAWLMQGIIYALEHGQDRDVEYFDKSNWMVV